MPHLNNIHIAESIDRIIVSGDSGSPGSVSISGGGSGSFAEGPFEVSLPKPSGSFTITIRNQEGKLYTLQVGGPQLVIDVVDKVPSKDPYQLAKTSVLHAKLCKTVGLACLSRMSDTQVDSENWHTISEAISTIDAEDGGRLSMSLR